MNDSTEVRLTATVQRVLSHDSRTGHSILRAALDAPGSGLPAPLAGVRQLTITGTLHGVSVGDRIRVVGDPVQHARFGWQLRAKRMVRADLLRRAGADLVLKTGCFGRHSRDEIEQARSAIPRLSEALEQGTVVVAGLKGTDRKLVERLLASWQECQPLRAAAGYLEALGMGADAIGRVVSVYGTGTIDRVTKSPYDLLGVPGIGFRTVDALAKRLGIAEDAQLRLAHSIDHLVERARERGDTIVSPGGLVASAGRLAGLSNGVMAKALHYSVQKGSLSSTPDGIGNAQLVSYEREIAERLKSRIKPAKALPLGPQAEHLYDEQRAALEVLLPAQTGILTGGPGVGKTTVTRALMEALSAEGGEILLAAPTGQAARRMAAATGAETFTVHQLLKSQGAAGFQHNEENPLTGSALIVDEASMLDVSLTAALLRAMPPNMRLYLVGDPDQLPSVDAGNVLSDLINAKVLPVAKLTQVRRQAHDSAIVQVAHSFLRGEVPNLLGAASDYLFIPAKGDAAIAKRLEQAVTDMLPSMGFAPNEIQVLTPQRTTLVGVQLLNRQLQARLNPPGPQALHLFGDHFGPGDRVMQVVNDHERGLSNGQTGVIAHIDGKARAAWVRFDDQLLAISAEQMAQMRLAYAATVHKSQGSEYGAVVVPISSSHAGMLTRRLLYTALTRGKKQVIFIGEQEALQKGLANTADAQRKTQLAGLLRGMVRERQPEEQALAM